MNKFLSLLRMQLNAQWGISAAIRMLKSDAKSRAKALGFCLLMIVVLGEFVGMFGFSFYWIHKAAKMINSPQVVITLAAIAVGFVTFLFGVFYILGALFFAKDTEFLAPLPIKQSYLFLSKFALIYAGEMFFSLALGLPAVIIYGIDASKGVLYYIAGAICILLLPLIPLAFAALIDLALMNIVGSSKRRDLITVVGSMILVVGMIIGQNMLIASMPEQDLDKWIVKILTDNMGLIEFVGRAFPPAVWMTKALSAGTLDALINLALFISVSIAAVALVSAPASYMYLRGAEAQLETAKKGKKNVKVRYKSSSALRAVFLNEWRVVVRSPMYALNSLAGIVMGPVLLAMPLFGGNFSKDASTSQIFSFINNAETQTTVMLAFAGMLTFFSLLNTAVSTTISREGRNIWILKTVPVRFSVQVTGKMLAGYFISILTIITSTTMAVIAFKLQPEIAIMSAVLAAIIALPMSSLSVIVDILRPKLVWSSEQEAIKQNLNTIIAMGANLLLAVAFSAISWLICKTGASIYLVFALMAVLLLAAAFVLYNAMSAMAEKRMPEIY